MIPLLLSGILALLQEQELLLNYLLLLVLQVSHRKLRRLKKFKQKLKERKRRVYVPERGKTNNPFTLFNVGIQKPRNRVSPWLRSSPIYNITGLETEEFYLLYRAVKPQLLQRCSHALNEKISLLLSLYFLRHCTKTKIIGDLFGVSESTARRTVSTVLPVLYNELRTSNLITFPDWCVLVSALTILT